MENNNNEKKSSIEINIEAYEKLISENASIKKELEFIKTPKEENIIISNSHTSPIAVEEKPKEKENIF